MPKPECDREQALARLDEKDCSRTLSLHAGQVPSSSCEERHPGRRVRVTNFHVQVSCIPSNDAYGMLSRSRTHDGRVILDPVVNEIDRERPLRWPARHISNPRLRSTERAHLYLYSTVQELQLAL